MDEMRDHALDACGASNTVPQTAGQFLSGTGIKSLVLLGKCMEYFGTKLVMGFLLGLTLGASGVQGYAIFKPLPFKGIYSPPSLVPSPAPTAETKVIRLRGKVQTLDGLPPKESFLIGILEGSQHGPFDSHADGSFVVTVPYAGEYHIAVIDSSLSHIHLNGDLHIDKEGDEYQFDRRLIFPNGDR